MSSNFDYDSYGPIEPERPSSGWSLQKRIIFGLIAIIAILSMLGSAIAGIVWFVAQDERQPPPQPTPTPWWGPVVELPVAPDLSAPLAELVDYPGSGTLSIKRVWPMRTASDSSASPSNSSSSNRVWGSATLTYSISAIGSVASVSRIMRRKG
jgi:hypothetical protein